MAPKSASGKRGSRKGVKKAPVSNSIKAETLFPVGRLNRMLKQGRFAERVGGSAGVFMAGVLDYITAEFMEIAGTVCHEAGQKIIAPRHINIGVRSDRLLNKMMATCTIIESPVQPNIHDFLLPKKGKKNAGAVADASQPL